MTLVPTYIKLIAFAVWSAALVTFGFVRGLDYESMRRDAKDAAAMVQFDAGRRVYVKRVEVIKIKYIERRAADVKLRDDLLGELAKHATEIPDPPQCWLAPERVQSINRAIESGPDRPGVPAAVRVPHEALLREPSGDRGVGDPNGVRISIVL